MIPLRDENPSGTFPFVTIGIIVFNIVVFLFELSLGDRLEEFILSYGLVPLKVWHYGRIPSLSFREAFFPFISSMFLHGGWVHIIGNMWYLWIFGDNIEDRLGHLRFAVFYLLCGIGSGLIHTIMNPKSGLPCVGASGAVAGVLGAYFLCFPMARVLTIIPIFIFIEFVELPAMIFLFFWFFLQFFNGALSIAFVSQTIGGVAWWAHIGGFIIGIVLVLVFPKSRRSKQSRYRVWYER